MGKASVVQVQHDVPGNASREVFQGLFKDLGKQAMALEAILRAVCGRVDKMENWLTEVSFGMTELDLKLRNIAHNIDGTAVVDDQGQGPHRWAIPQPDGNKPLAPTVSKKLGTDKKAVRVTGMAAAILDRLATTSNAVTPTEAEIEKVEKTSSKKKGKDKKHSIKKEKVHGSTDTTATPLPPVAENVKPTESMLPTPVPITQTVPVPVVKPESVPATTKPELLASIPAPVEQVTAVQADAIETTQQNTIESLASTTVEEVPASIEPTASEEENTVVDIPAEDDHSAALNESEVQDSTEAVLPQDCQAVGKKLIPSPEPDMSDVRTCTSSSESTPVMSARETIESRTTVETKSNVLVEVSPEIVERDSVSEEAMGKQTSIPEVVASSVSQAPVVKQAAPQLDQPSTPIAVNQTAPVEVVPASSTPIITKKVPVAPPKPSMPTPSVSSILPTVQVERTIEAFVLKTPEPVTRPSNTPSTIASIAELQAAPIELTLVEPARTLIVEKVAMYPVSTSAPVVLQTSTLPAHASPPKPVQQPSPAVIKTVGVPIRERTALQKDKPENSHQPEVAEPTNDPLLSRRTSSRRRSSKIIPRSSINKKIGDNDLVRCLSENKRESYSRRGSVSPLAKSQEQEIEEVILQQAAKCAPTLQVVPQVESTPEVSNLTNTTEQADIEERSEESGSDESSSDGSGSSSGDDDEDDAEAGEAVEEISKTMTALRKLKKANMLSPEEEVELKERAHKKWFQLKGHLKEKQKKDVTNILLKRKKTVFTVSARIELLEEKSRELFAGLKQMTNEMREKNDRATHETLRRRVTDIEQSLLSVDLRIASLSAPAMDKVGDLESEVASIRTTVQLQLTTAQSEATARHSLLEQAIASQRALVEAFAQDVPTQLNAQAEIFLEKLKQQPDFTAAIENLKKGLRRKADLKLLKELEARLLGLDAESEDCLVRCLSCHKEVVNLHNESEVNDQEIVNAGGGPSPLRKVNPGPSSARIYRSNMPFSAQHFAQDSISEEFPDERMVQPPQTLTQPESNLFAVTDPELQQQFQSAGDFHASEKAPAVRVPSVKWSTPTETSSKRDVKSAKASPLSLMNITARRAILSPDRPISAPVVMKKKNSAVRSKSILKSLTPQLDPPQ